MKRRMKRRKGGSFGRDFQVLNLPAPGSTRFGRLFKKVVSGDREYAGNGGGPGGLVCEEGVLSEGGEISSLNEPEPSSWVLVKEMWVDLGFSCADLGSPLSSKVPLKSGCFLDRPRSWEISCLEMHHPLFSKGSMKCGSFSHRLVSSVALGALAFVLETALFAVEVACEVESWLFDVGSSFAHPDRSVSCLVGSVSVFKAVEPVGAVSDSSFVLLVPPTPDLLMMHVWVVVSVLWVDLDTSPWSIFCPKVRSCAFHPPCCILGPSSWAASVFLFMAPCFSFVHLFASFMSSIEAVMEVVCVTGHPLFKIGSHLLEMSREGIGGSLFLSCPSLLRFILFEWWGLLLLAGWDLCISVPFLVTHVGKGSFLVCSLSFYLALMEIWVESELLGDVSALPAEGGSAMLSAQPSLAMGCDQVAHLCLLLSCVVVLPKGDFQVDVSKVADPISVLSSFARLALPLIFQWKWFRSFCLRSRLSARKDLFTWLMLASTGRLKPRIDHCF